MATAFSPMQSDFLTVQEFGQIVRLDRQTIYKMVHAGKIPATTVGRSIRIPRSAVEKLMDQVR